MQIKIELKAFHNIKDLFGQAILTSLGSIKNEKNKKVFETLDDPEGLYRKEGIMDIEFKINGIELNMQEFFDRFSNALKDEDSIRKEYDKKFEKWRNDYNSRNSPEAKRVKMLEKMNNLIVEACNIKFELQNMNKTSEKGETHGI
jgi:hypothetical protein